MFERKAMGKKIMVIFLFFLENSITLDSQEHIFYIYIYPEPKSRSLDTPGQSYSEKKGKETSIRL